VGLEVGLGVEVRVGLEVGLGWEVGVEVGLGVGLEVGGMHRVQDEACRDGVVPQEDRRSLGEEAGC
jgi:hypothetical protein